MKKMMRPVFAALLAGMMLLAALTGCSQKFGSMGEYLNDQAVQAELVAAIAEAEAQGLGVDVSANANTLTYTYTYADGIEFTDEDKALLQDALDSSADQFNEMVDQLKPLLSFDDPVIEVIYLDSAGAELARASFTGSDSASS